MTAVKWAVFFVAVLASQPVGQWLRGRPALRFQLWTVVGLLPFVFTPAGIYHDIALVFFGDRVGDTHGIEVSVADWLALCLLFAAKPPKRPLPFRSVLALYMLAVLLSVPQARWTLHAASYAWKFGRMWLMCVAIWRAGSEDERVPAALLRGMTFGLLYEGVLVTWQHFGLGTWQATGSFAHQNTLGMMTNLVVMASIARILAGPTPLTTKLAPIAAVLAGLFSLSRGTLLFLGMGTALVFVGSVWRGVTPRKTWIGMCGLGLLVVIVPLALSAVGSRTAAERSESMSSRVQLEDAAAMMIQGRPMGVGANHYSVELLLGGYGARVGLGWTMRIAIVHNVYWLTAAELGYVGLGALLLLFFVPLRLAFSRGSWRRPGRGGDVILGLGVGLVTVYLHSFFEWAWRQTEVSYVYFMSAAMIPVLALHLRARATRPAARRAPPPGRAWPPSELPAPPSSASPPRASPAGGSSAGSA